MALAQSAARRASSSAAPSWLPARRVPSIARCAIKARAGQRDEESSSSPSGFLAGLLVASSLLTAPAHALDALSLYEVRVQRRSRR